MFNSSLDRHLLNTSLIVFLLLVVACQPGSAPDPDPEPQTYTQYGTPFSQIPENEDIVIYEVNLRAFGPQANLQAVQGRLDDIKALGINVLWLMPVHPVGEVRSVNSPYSVRDYKAVGAEYGTLADLRALTDAAHARGMAVIMDWVANHTAWDHPWIAEKSWYTRDANGDIVHPPGTNWQDVADLNFENPDMRLAMIDAMKYWVLEANVDGYRCDAADFVPYDFWVQALDSLEAIPGRTLIYLAEGARDDHFAAGFHLNFSWQYYGQLKSVFGGQDARGLHTAHQAEYASVPAGKHKLRFTTNHDESAWDATPVRLFGGEAGALAASAITVFQGGVPLLYGSQEIGREETLPFFSNTTLDWNQNPDMQQAYREMIQAYTSEAVARRGALEDFSNRDVVCFRKTVDQDTLWVLVNVRNQPRSIDLPLGLKDRRMAQVPSGDTLVLGSDLLVGAFEYVLMKP